MSRLYFFATLPHKDFGVAMPTLGFETADHTGGGFDVAGLHPSSLAAMLGKGPKITKGERFDLKFNLDPSRSAFAVVINTTKQLPHIEWTSSGGLGPLPIVGLGALATQLFSRTISKNLDKNVTIPGKKEKSPPPASAAAAHVSRLKDSRPRARGSSSDDGARGRRVHDNSQQHKRLAAAPSDDDDDDDDDDDNRHGGAPSGRGPRDGPDRSRPRHNRSPGGRVARFRERRHDDSGYSTDDSSADEEDRRRRRQRVSTRKYVMEERVEGGRRNRPRRGPRD